MVNIRLLKKEDIKKWDYKEWKEGKTKYKNIRIFEIR